MKYETIKKAIVNYRKGFFTRDILVEAFRNYGREWHDKTHKYEVATRENHIVYY